MLMASLRKPVGGLAGEGLAVPKVRHAVSSPRPPCAKGPDLRDRHRHGWAGLILHLTQACAVEGSAPA